jgi:SH3-like domain-containing protein
MKFSYALLTLALIFVSLASISPAAISNPLQSKTAPARPDAAQAKPAAAPVTPCDANAYVVEEDENGLNVRSGPGKEYSVIAVLTDKDDDEQLVHITGISGSWMRVSSAEALNGKSLFKGTGWVFAGKLGTSVRPDSKGGYQARLYQDADLKSPVVAKVPAEDGTVLVSCKGKWLQVKLQGETIKGWLSPEGQCPNPVTTCP